MKEIQSSLEAFFALGFTIIGDSRDFQTGSIQVILGRGNEKLVWTFPLKRGVIAVSSADGVSYLKATPDQISFDVVREIQEAVKQDVSGGEQRGI